MDFRRKKTEWRIITRRSASMFIKMNYWKRSLKSFTVIEMLVVMMISAIGIGIAYTNSRLCMRSSGCITATLLSYHNIMYSIACLPATWRRPGSCEKHPMGLKRCIRIKWCGMKPWINMCCATMEAAIPSPFACNPCRAFLMDKRSIFLRAWWIAVWWPICLKNRKPNASIERSMELRCLSTRSPKVLKSFFLSGFSP